MNHSKSKRKFGRKSNEYKALIQSLACNLVRDEKIITTEAKAKELRPYIEKLVTRAKSSSVADRRVIASRLSNSKILSKKLVEKIATQYTERSGGYTRITKLPLRQGDAAKMAHIEFV